MSPSDNSVNNSHDVIIVGAGPAGATAAYYLSKATDEGRAKSVALLDKASFPRDKFCGDAWCAPALDILEDMGVLQELEQEGLAQDSTPGGYISPAGESYVSTGGGSVKDARCYAIKRVDCDERIVQKAVEQGVELFENSDFEDATLDTDGLWTVTCKDGRVFRANMLLAADGANSQVARTLKVINTDPNSAACRQYIKGGTHNFKSGGLRLYPDYVAPGYVTMFRHLNDDINIGVFINSGRAVSSNAFQKVCDVDFANDPLMQRVLGPNVEFLEEPQIASLRTGGVDRSTSKQFMAVGDAAGHCDPLTGHGIHSSMVAGKLAAQRVHEMAEANDFSAEACQVYHQRWMNEFGKDFPESESVQLNQKHPLLLDAATVVAKRKGDAFMADVGAAMTRVKPKSTLLRPGIAIPLGLEVVKQHLVQKVFKSYPSSQAAYEARAVESDPRPTAFANACLIDPDIDTAELKRKAPVVDLVAWVSPRKDGSKNKQDGSKAYDKLFQYASDDESARRVTVIFASELGFTEEVTEQLCERLLANGGRDGAQSLSMRFIDAEHYQVIDWNEVDTCLLLSSTAGDGVPPEKAKELFEFLENEKPDLSHMNAAVLALGDSSYPHFCRAGDQLEELLKGCESTIIKPIVKVDAEDMGVVDEWVNDVNTELCSKEYWLERPEQSTDEKLPEKAEELLKSRDGQPVKANANRPQIAKLVERTPLVDTDAGGKEVCHIELDISAQTDPELAPFEWQAGDALGVLPVNATEEVKAVLQHLSCHPDEVISLPRNKGSVSIKEALTHHCDIKHLNAQLLHHLADNSSGDEERRHLEEAQVDVKKYLEGLELQDLLKRLPRAVGKLASQTLVDNLRALTPRYYSIASSQKADKNKVALSVGTVRHEVESDSRVGVSSTYLNDRLDMGGEVGVFVHANSNFRIPSVESGNACIMIGAGTGIAPYRAFMQELSIRAESANTTMLEQTEGNAHLLFFGCRHEKADFLYAEQWNQWQAEGVLELNTAFSRDQEEKVYVQDRIREKGELLWQRIQRGDHFYVCGDATYMAADVEKALLDIVKQYGLMNAEDAQLFIDSMVSNGRYQKDVWA
jgi:NADPH-dependent sulfite reductase flavoprotein alpha-component